MELFSGGVIVFLIVAMLIGLFWLGREIVCWYFKLSEISDLLVEIRDELKKEKK
jgi:hypothetical protein